MAKREKNEKGEREEGGGKRRGIRGKKKKGKR